MKELEVKEESIIVVPQLKVEIVVSSTDVMIIHQEKEDKSTTRLLHSLFNSL